MYDHNSDSTEEAIGFDEGHAESIMEKYANIMESKGTQSMKIEKLEKELDRRELAFLLQQQTRKLFAMAQLAEGLTKEGDPGYDKDGCNCPACRAKRVQQQMEEDKRTREEIRDIQIPWGITGKA